MAHVLRALLLALMTAACSGSDSEPALPTAPSSTPLFVDSMTVEPRALNGGGGSDAMLTLNIDAPAVTTVQLSSSSPAVSLPAAVTIQRGARTASFSITTQAVSEETVADVAAVIGDRTTRRQVYVWPIEWNSFWYDSETGEGIGGGGAGRYTSATVPVRAACDDGNIYAQINAPGGTWNANFLLPRGAAMRPGTFAFSSPRDLTRPYMQMSGRGMGCSTTSGEFTVDDVDLSESGTVNRFVARFWQQCENNPARLRGEIRLATPPQGIGGGSPRRCNR